MPIYWLVLTAKVALLLLMPGTSSKLQPGILLASYLLLPLPPNQPLLAVSWTLTHEFLFYAVCLAGLVYGRRCFGFLMVCWSLAILGVALLVPLAQIQSWPIWLQFVLRERNLGFGLGSLGGLMLLNRTLRPRWRPALLAGLGGLAWIAAIVLLGALRGVWMYSLIFGLPSLALILGCAELECRRPPAAPGRAGRLLLLLGDSSYVLYLIHFMLFDGFSRGVPRVFWLPLALGAGVLAHVLVERPLNQHMRRWIGQR